MGSVEAGHQVNAACCKAEFDGDYTKHCECVPLLRAEIERLRWEVDVLTRWHNDNMRERDFLLKEVRWERAAAVQWLRRMAEELEFRPKGSFLADAIERGEHRPSQPPR